MTTQNEFVHLHNHSEYSLSDGIIRVTDSCGGPSQALKDLAAAGAKGFAITDQGNMYGAVEFYRSAKAVGLKPIIGCELRNTRGHFPLTVLAASHEGYQNLMALCAQPHVENENLARHSKGLIVLSGSRRSDLNRWVLSGDLIEAERLATWFRDNLDADSYYLELMDHGLEEERLVTKGFLELSARTGIPLVAANDCHYASRDDHDAHDMRLCIASGHKLTDADRPRLAHPEYYIKSPAEMHRLFGDIAPQALTNTLKIAERCDLKIPLDTLQIPAYPVPEGFSQDSYLERLCKDGLKERLHGAVRPEYEARLGYELDIIKRQGLSGYFLLVGDIVGFALKEGIRVGPGRGATAGALAAYALRITGIDPLRHGLLFERFHNPDRLTMPMIDIDFADTGRDRVIDYARRKYGSDCVARLITFGALGARSVVRDVGQALGIPSPTIDEVIKNIPAGPRACIDDAIQAPGMAAIAQDPAIQRLLKLSQQLEGLKRHTGVHAAAIVITPKPVVQYSPLTTDARSGEVTTQYDYDSCRTLGLMGIDFLSLRALRTINDAAKRVKAEHAPGFDIDNLPLDDPKTFELLRAGNTGGVFQLDSAGIKKLLRRVEPTTFDDVVSLIALYRPGPIESGLVESFIARKHGREAIAYDHPSLEPILKGTYGCLIFQEQVMQISRMIAGFTRGEATGLRRTIGTRREDRIEEARAKFIEGAASNMVTPELADGIYDKLVTFGVHGFCKAHAVSYGLMAYQTAFLKANYPDLFSTMTVIACN